MIEMLIGVAFAGLIFALPYVYERVGERISIPKFRKNLEEKMKEIDKKLEEVVSAGVPAGVPAGVSGASKKQAEEKVVPLNSEVNLEGLESNLENSLGDNLLEEMETASEIKTEMDEEENIETPDIPDLPDLNSDLDMDFEDFSQNIQLKSDEDGKHEKEVEKVEFDEEDDLISSIAREVQVKEEKEIDLLRDLKGQKFTAEELERELKEVLRVLRTVSGGG